MVLAMPMTTLGAEMVFYVLIRRFYIAELPGGLAHLMLKIHDDVPHLPPLIFYIALLTVLRLLVCVCRTKLHLLFVRSALFWWILDREVNILA